MGDLFMPSFRVSIAIYQIISKFIFVLFLVISYHYGRFISFLFKVEQNSRTVYQTRLGIKGDAKSQ